MRIRDGVCRKPQRGSLHLGLVPGKDQSGEYDPWERISGEGDEMLRRLLVSSAHYILAPFGEDSDLRRHGEKIAGRGGKNAKKRAVVAVARKLSVELHHLWVSGGSTNLCTTQNGTLDSRQRRSLEANAFVFLKR